ncbi:MAG: hypothetical protein AB8G22_01590 [Saprospiraceae bacterium]
MRYTLFLVFFLSLGITLSAQNDVAPPATINWGEEITEPSNSLITKMIAQKRDGFYALRVKGANGLSEEKIYIEEYDERERLKKSRELDLKFKNKQRQFSNILMHGRELYFLTTFNNQAKKKNYLFKQKISKKSLQTTGALEMIGEIDTKNRVREGSFGFNQSRDSSKLLIYHDLPYDRNQPERFNLRVFDENFDLAWEKNIVLPYADNQFAVEEYRVDRKGNVYLLGVVYQDGARERRRGKPNYRYSILAYTNQGENFQEYKLDLEDKFITDLTFRAGKNNELICTGFYSEKGTYSVKGTYFFRVNTETQEIYNKNLKEFGFEFLTQAYSDREVARAARAERNGDERREAELYRFQLDDLILRSDGGAVLIAEQYFIQERFRNDFNDPYRFGRFGGFNRNQGNNQVDYYYNYNDIIVVNIRPNGEIEWATRIPKRQVTVNDGGYYSSYSMAAVRDRIYFVFNDNGRNFATDRNENRIYNFNGKNSVISLAEVGKDGSLQIYPLFNNREANIITRPKICQQTGRKTMLVYGEKGRRYRFGNLTFD